METINGEPVSEEQIRAWAAEAEQGYDPALLRKPGRKPVGDGSGRVVPVRLDETILSTARRPGRARSHRSLGGDSGRHPRLRRVRVHQAALKQGITAADGAHTATNWVYASTLSEEHPARELRLGFDTAGRLLELLVLRFDSGTYC